MAFVSQDLLFQVIVISCLPYILTYVNQVFWKSLRKDLPVQQVDIYLNLDRFLEVLVKWMHERRGGKGILKAKRRDQYALLVVRESPVFHGVGLYTVSEIWHMAGKYYDMLSARILSNHLTRPFTHLDRRGFI